MSNSTVTSTTETITEHGIRKPDGTEIWEPNQVMVLTESGSTLSRTLQEVHEAEATRDRYRRYLASVAEEVGIAPDVYLAGHTLITRQRIVVTLPAVASETRLGYVAVPF